MLAFGETTVAQSLSPEDITKMVDKQINDLNPYQALLNDPDPQRSLSAMTIMLESGDESLRRMALEFGLLSPNATVKRAAFEGFLATAPILSMKFDGSAVKDSDFASSITREYSGTLDNGTGYWRVPVGPFLTDHKCYASSIDKNNCFITVNSDGIFLTPRRFNGRAVLSDTGTLEGSGTVYQVDETVPFTVQLID
ncbi:hypothetical protein GV67_15315 [Pseudorhizobium pelagicum]|uniref:Uncharacterized protein n=1 Tax=Pseudorhizobium pelagicum TaxID=1509405 RepID=A0A922NXB0_9HYPH|nr:hypothetical protein GV68_11120 [Pseudorhizobium pelagicum]KEQ08503.1 hypothetical protein GV67_15315 [Pseudorhizobium pelagicum]